MAQSIRRHDRLPDLTAEQIRYWIVRKRRAARTIRLERYWQTGRVLPLLNERDEISDLEKASIRQFGTRPRRRWFDHVLLIAEVLAVFSLIAVMGNGLSVLTTLNRAVASAFQPPTPQPTPIIFEVVLPEGHTPPNSPGGARPNEAEVPEFLRPIFRSAQAIPMPTPGRYQAIRIQIPAIDVDAPVVQGDGWEQLKKGVAQHLGTPDPGETGNIVLSGHNDVFGEVFRDLDRLQPGDAIILLTSQRRYVYIITGAQMVEPTAVEVMAPTSDARVTLISCHPYLVDIHRIVVSAVLQKP
ncbi:MAG: sortase [Chloroflexota bacterium]